MMSPRIQEREFILTRMPWKWLQKTAASGEKSGVMNPFAIDTAFAPARVVE
jgi:hypothetical protein